MSTTISMPLRMPDDRMLRLETERLILEPLEASHTSEFWELFGDERMHEFVPFERRSEVEHRARCAHWSNRVHPRTGEAMLNWAVRERATNRVIGHVQAGFADDRVATIGYMIATASQNRGFAAESLLATFVLLREAFGVVEVKAWIDTRNAASIRMVEKIGLRRVEKILNADHFRGASSDEYVYSMRLDRTFV